MGMVDTGPFCPFIPIFNTATNATFLIDAADEVAGSVCRVKAGNIRWVHFRTFTVTTGATVDVRVETVSATTGDPTGTLWGTNTNGSQVIASSDDNVWFRKQLTADAVVADDDVIGVLVVNPTTSFGNMEIARSVLINGPAATNTIRSPYGINPTRSGPLSAPAAILLEYDDNTFAYASGYAPFVSKNQSYSTSTNPDEACLVFTPKFAFRIFGFGMSATLSAAADYRVQLYEDGNNTPLIVTPTHDGDIVDSASSSGSHFGLFSSKYIVKPETKYRLAFLPLTSTSATFFSHLIPSANSKKALNINDSLQHGKRNRSSTTDPDSAAWTDTEEIPCIFPYADQVYVPSGLRRDNPYARRRVMNSVYGR